MFWRFPYKNGLCSLFDLQTPENNNIPQAFKEVLRPFNGHTPRKLPAFAATSRFNAYQAELLYHINRPKSRVFSIYFNSNFARTFFKFQKLFWLFCTILPIFCVQKRLLKRYFNAKFKINPIKFVKNDQTPSFLTFCSHL